MKRIIKIRESILKWVIILLGIALVFINIEKYEYMGPRRAPNFGLYIIIYMHILVLTISFIEQKIVEYRVKELDLNYMKSYKNSSLVKYCMIYSAFIVIAWYIDVIRAGLLMIIMVAIILQYISTKIKNHIECRVMYKDNILVIGNKLYDIEKIKSVRDNFGSNFYMEVGDEEYEIFCGQVSTKKELMNILGNKII
jgi:hypothetical protein